VTPTEIDSYSAGPVVDALVAEKLGLPTGVHYSNNDGLVHLILMALDERGFELKVYDCNAGYEVCFSRDGHQFMSTDKKKSLAVCRAALKAVSTPEGSGA